MKKSIRSLLSFLLSFQFLVFDARAESRSAMDEKLSFAAEHVARLYSSAANMRELQSIMSANRSHRDQKYISEVFSKFDPKMKAPQFKVQDNNLIISGYGDPISIDFTKGSDGRFAVDGVTLTVDPTSSLQMQTEIFQRKLREFETGKKGDRHSFFSLLIPEAQAAGKAQVIRSSIKSGAQRMKELKAAASVEKEAELAGQVAAKSDLEKGALVKLKDGTVGHLKAHLPAFTIVAVAEVLRATGTATFCRIKYGNFEVTPESIQQASFCKGYLAELKKTDEMTKADLEKKKKDDPKIAAAGALEAMTKQDLQGVSFFNGWKVCPHQAPDKNYRGALAIVTEDSNTKDKKVEMNIVKARYEGTTLKEIKMYSSTPDADKSPLATYIPEAGSLGVIKIPNPKYNAKKPGLEPPELEINVTKDNSKTDTEIANKQKLHTEIYGKIMLSLSVCVDEAKNAEGRKAAEGATTVSPGTGSTGTGTESKKASGVR